MTGTLTARLATGRLLHPGSDRIDWLYMIKGLHNNACRCQDSEETRRFYEEFLSLPFFQAFEISVTDSGRNSMVLHGFYRMKGSSFLAFFEEPEAPFDFKAQRDCDLHIALEVRPDYLQDI